MPEYSTQPASAIYAQRHAAIQSSLSELSDTEREAALAALDQITRPLSPRELEKALFATNLSATHRKAVVSALKRFSIIIVK